MCHLLKICFQSTVLLFLCTSLYANQPLKFQRITTKDGLSNNTVQDIDQDIFGRIWFATYDGITCFDGVGFQTVKPRLMETGALLPSGKTEKICVDSLGNVWVLFEKNELIKIIGNNGECYKYDYVRENASLIEDLILDPQGNLVLLENHRRWQYDASIDSFKVIKDIPSDHSGAINGSIRALIQKEVPEMIIHSTFESPITDDFLIATRNKGIFIVSKKDPSKFVNCTFDPINESSIPSNEVYCVFQDKNGNVWAGTKDGGACRSIGKNNVLGIDKAWMDKDMPFVNAPVRAIQYDERGTLWVGTYNKGLVVFEKGSSRHIPLSVHGHDENWDWIRSIYQSSDGFIWIGSYNGLCRMDPVRYTKKYYNSGILGGPLHNGRIYSMAEDLHGNLFIAEWGGLTYFDRKNNLFTRLDTLNELNGNNLRKLLIDRKRNIWVGTETSGIFVLDASGKEILKTFTFDNTGKSINSNSIFEIQEDPEGNIWVGSFCGINKIDTAGNIENLAWANNNLPSTIIYKIFFDKHGLMWCTSAKGLLRIDEKAKNIRIFDQNDGLGISDFLEGAGYMDQQRRLYLGGVDGLYSFLPDQVAVSHIVPGNLLGSVTLNGNALSLPFIQCNDSVYSFNSRENNFNFSLKSILVDSPGKTKIAWKLVPVDHDFATQNNAIAEISYKNLPPGRYTLIAKSANADGIWSGEKQLFAFRILKPFWQQYYFIFSALVFLIFLTVLISRLRIQKVKRKNKQLEAMVECRTQKVENQKIKLEDANRELEEKNRKVMAQKDQILAQRDHLIEMHKKLEESNDLQQRFFINISHDIRTPLSLIHGPLSEIMQRKDIPLALLPKLKTMQTHSDFLIQLLNQILDKKKLQTGIVQLNHTHGDIVHICRSIVGSFQQEAEQIGVNLQFEPSHDSFYLRFDFEKLQQIIYNLLANAIKFTLAGGTILCKLTLRQNDLEIMVSDTGIGIPGDRVKYIFDRYYQVGKSQNLYKGGSGIGLSLVKDYVDLFNGDITVKSSEGKGSDFIVALPHKSNDAEQADQPGENTLAGHTDTYEFDGQGLDDQKDQLLLVEDNVDLRNYLFDILSEKYAVVAFGNGCEALGYLRKNKKVCIVLSDWMLPQMDGIELCKTIKKKDRYKTIPFILLTALSEINNQKEAYRAGVDDFITKPFDPQVLLLKIALLLERNSLIKSAAIVDEKINPENKTVVTFNERLFEKLKMVVESEMSNPEFGQSELALALGLSQMQLYRKLKDLVQMSPNEFIRSIRIKRAKQLLENEELIINEVGYLVGFNDPKYFSRCFSKDVGMSPSKYRREMIKTFT
jgi:signal transduction histidine kinase/ligand-binding sensor domain-containing protein/DNA-binding response OmpR family regulator